MVQPPTPILDVRFYATAGGSEPVRKWLHSLSHESRKIIGDDIKTVQLGWPIGMPLVRNGFVKKTQQTTKQDLALARKRMKEVHHG